MRIQKEEIKQDGLILSTLALMTAVSGLVSVLLINFPSDVLICWISLSKWTLYITCISTILFFLNSLLLNIIFFNRRER